ncbi:MAG TPA: T9SS type A sorting domain-containing protein, partial [Saprospiraceae bacterium]|nr:T9SS type A sorting domain-containing protein [Saprospiraceae bacterium]
GIYSVSLTVTDNPTNYDSTYTYVDFINVGGYASNILTLTGNDSICEGSSTQINADAGYDYLWSNLTTTSNIVVNTTGDYHVLISDTINPSCNVQSDTIHIQLIPNPIVDLGQDTSQCGGSILLDAGNSGSTYLWNNSSIGQTLSAASSGTYFVTVANTFNCVGHDTVQVNIFNIPTVNLGSDIIQPNPPAILDAGIGFSSYLWNTLAVTQTISVNTNGNYWVTITDDNGCSNSDTVMVTFNAGIENGVPQNIQITFYPNPTDGLIHISWSDNAGDVTLIEWMSIDGKLIDKETISLVQLSNNYSKDLSLYAAGIYQVRVTNEKGSYTTRIVVK